MNKELIKKYKKEFDYWVNDGTLLVADSYEKRWITLTKNVWLCETTTKNLLIIIDDKYVELRKALAEGKTVEVLTDTMNIDRTYWDATLEVESYLRKKGAHQYFKFQSDYPSADRKKYLFYVDCGGDYPKGFINGCSKTSEDNLDNYTYKTLDNVYAWVKTQEIDTNIEVKNYRIKPDEYDIKVGDYIYDIQRNKYYIVENVLADKLETKLFRVWKSSIDGVYYKLWKPKQGELVIMKTNDYSTGFTVTTWEENSKFTPVPFTGELPE